jgi:hypothetical protein
MGVPRPVRAVFEDRARAQQEPGVRHEAGHGRLIGVSI